MPRTRSRPMPCARRRRTRSTALGQPDGLNDLPAYAKQAAAIVSQERDDLKALQAPPGDEDRVEELNETLDAVVRVAKGLEKVAASGDPAAIDDFVKQNGAVDQKAKKLAQRPRHAGVRGVAVTPTRLPRARGRACWPAAAATAGPPPAAAAA